MKLSATEQFLKQKEQEMAFDSYAVFVSSNGEEKLFTSSNVNDETLFDIASIGKIMPTSTLVVRALSEGKLSLEDTIDKFFTGIDIPEDRKKIKIKHLITHSSGIVSGLIPDRIADSGKDAVAEFILSRPLKFAPGTDYEYACFGFMILGFILEKTYGMTLEELFKKYIADPLGFKRSQYVLPLDAENAAKCWRWKYVGKRREDGERAYTMGCAVGSGAIHSCIYDLKRFCDAILNKSEILYPKEWYEIAEKNYTPTFPLARGLGYHVVADGQFAEGHFFPAGSFGHTGYTGCSFNINREMNTYVIILSNATRCNHIRSNYTDDEYPKVEKLRGDIYDVIGEDLKNEGIIV